MVFPPNTGKWRLGDRAAMVEVVTPLTDIDLADLAHYLAYVGE